MNKEQVDTILNTIKTSTDKSTVYKHLVKLRMDLVKDRDGVLLFRDCGGVPVIARLLSKPHEKILEVALSILGNCCTDDLCCKQALEHKTYLSLTTIFKSIPNPVIQCRACRLLGNLTKNDKTDLLENHCTIIAQSIVKIIESTTDEQTRIMAFRACRFLFMKAQFLKNFLQANGFVQLLRVLNTIMKNENEKQETTDVNLSTNLGLKRNLHREKYFEEVARNLEGVRSDIFDQEVLKKSTRITNIYTMPKEIAAIELANEIMKSLLSLSAQPLNFESWKSLIRHGSTFGPIVYFASENDLQRNAALRILSNFAKNPGAFFMLSNADAIVAACELIVAENITKPLSESEVRQCINIICVLSSDACNRSKIRRSGALRKLIIMIRESSSQSERSLILYILNNFQYDNMSMELMLREGLVAVLIRELNDYLTCDDEHYKRKREERLKRCKKRKRSATVTKEVCKLPKTREISPFDIESPSSSPQSYHCPASPCSSRSMSPIGVNSFSFDDNSDEENYSPACSDDEISDEGDVNQCVNENSAQPSTNSMEIMKLLDIAAEDIDVNISDKEDDYEISQDTQQMSHSTIDIIENLLFRVTLMINKRSELGKPETFESVIRAVNLFGANNNFANCLTNILLESQFFAQIIKQGVVHQLYQLTKMKEIQKEGLAFLNTLTNVGESNYGKSELILLLRSDNIIAQNRAAVAVAYIIKSQRLLYQFLHEGNALTILLDLLLSKKMDELSNEACDAVTFMSRHSLRISLPNYDKCEEIFDCNSNDEDSSFLLHEDCNMRFIVKKASADDNQDVESIAIGFNKQLLCESSEVFNTMLNSDFREGKENEVQLFQYTVSGMRYFLNLIVRQSQNMKYNIPPADKFYAILEAFEMARVYIIPQMEYILKQLLIQLIDSNNCLQLLEWSLKNYDSEMTEISINYFLCSVLPTSEKIQLFRKADCSLFASEWFKLIIEAVFDRCRSST